MAARVDRVTQAFQAQQRGELRDATESYLSILNEEPENVNALQLLGLIHLNAGRFVEADQLISRAIELCPNVAELHNNRGLCRLGQARLRESEIDLLEAIRLQPVYPEAFNNLGLVASQLGRPADAEASFIRAIKLQPNYPAAFNNLATLVLKLGRAANAATCCRRAVALRPVYPEAELTLGLALEQLGKVDEAEACFRRSLADRPHPVAWTGLARLLRNSGRALEAERCVRAALSLTENSSENYREFGFVLLKLGKLQEAEVAAHKAVELEPDIAESHRLLGLIFREQGRLKEAESCYLQAVDLDRENAEAHLELATLHLLTERWKTGWKGYEWRWRCRNAHHAPFEQPTWDGSALDGKTILLWSESADEETLQYARYSREVKARGGRVILRAPVSLRLLLRAEHLGIDRVILEDQPIPAFDTHAPLASLPRIFGTTFNTIPAVIPFLPHLEFDATTWSFWQDRLAQFPGERVGIFWRADPSDRSSKTPPPNSFATLGSVPGISLINLQKDVASTDLPPGIRALDSAFNESSWVDMAAILFGLDLLISVDSPVAHLAASQGVPVWLALPFMPDSRWLLGREESPWYPAMRLFRQQNHSGWNSVFDRLAMELERWMRASETGSGVRRRQSGMEFTGGIHLNNI